LLDRAREKAYRPRAYLRAAEVVRGLAPGELERRIADGTLTDLEHIGPKTAAVIVEAASGVVPAYLTELEESTGIRAGAGDELVRQLRGDCHTHSTWSDGGADIDTMARAARALGQEYIALTDHSPR